MLSRTLPIGMARSVAFASLSPARKVLLSGRHAHRLADYITARAACEMKPVRIICGDNHFDPYAVSRFAKSRGVRPEDALNSILIARAFTAYQFAELLTRLPPSPSNDIVLISGPCSAFFDEDLPFVDAARLFYRTLWRVVELAGGGMTLMLVESRRPRDSRRAYFLKDLCHASDVVMKCDGAHTFQLEHPGRIALSRLASVGRATGD